MIDVICNQKGKGIPCVYVGIGIQAAKAKGILNTLTERGALDYTTMVISTSNEPPSLQYIAPYAGAAIAEEFMYQGKHVLIVYDDLSKQAKAYRQVSLLLKRSPGRDAYPGDIFFLHSRLLERAAKLSQKLGGGSITALPVAETQAGDVSDYIITNLMSITDGHIYLDANMMNEGILPAVNSGTSVSRIGSKVQTSLLKKMGELAGRVMARYEEVKSFETINTEVAEDTLRDIRCGKRVHEIFAQDSDVAYSYDEQIVLIQLVVSGILDELELFEFADFKKNFLEYYRKHRTDAFVQLCDSAKKMDDVSDTIEKFYQDYTKSSKSSQGSY
ncbi:MAG TPA: F0F1 ATP synthase subunit alpha, partial [Candidatus Gracilibacteria bacterium]|nr:F0F1 ATP synthase subunit alpha [Candidatus Gracilibacteria bacterium]